MVAFAAEVKHSMKAVRQGVNIKLMIYEWNEMLLQFIC